MKTAITIPRNATSKLIRVLLLAVLLCIAPAANAQCTASFTAADSAGTTYFTNLSTGAGLTSSWDFGDGTVFSTSGNANYTYAASGMYYVCLTVTDFLGTCTATYCDSIMVPYGSSGACMGNVNAGFVAADSSGYGYFYNYPSPSATGQVYFWDFGDGTNSSVVGTTTHLYPANGTYYVCLTVYETGGGTDSCQYCNFVTISSGSGGTTGSCMGVVNPTFTTADSMGYGVFTNTPTGSGQTYFWDFGDGTSSSAVGNTNHLYPSNGTYTVCLTVYNAVDSCQYCNVVTISSGGSGTSGSCLGVVDPTFTAVDSMGYGVFTNTPTGPGQNYYWSFGDGTISSAVGNTNHLYSAGGTYTVCLTVFSAVDSCQYCTTLTIGGSSFCNAYFYAISDSSGGVNLYNASSGGITNYVWDFGDGTTSTLANPVNHSYSSTGAFNICLTVSNPATSCSSTYCTPVFITSCTASFTYALDAFGNGCSFFGSASGSGSNYFWNFGDGTTSTLQNPYHVYAANGYYSACLTVTSLLDTTCNSTFCQGIYTAGICDALFYVSQDTTNLYNYFVYNNSTTTASTTYLWDFGDGTTSTAAYPSHTYATTSPVQLCLTVSDGSGCTDTYCDTIVPGMAMSNVFTINVVGGPTGVSEQTSLITTLENYPNPFSESTAISYSISMDANVSIHVTDLLGKTIAKLVNENKQAGNYTISWNPEGFSDGMYLLQLNVNNTISTKKLVISR